MSNTAQQIDRLWYIAIVRNTGVTLPATYPLPYHSDPGADDPKFKYVLGLLRDFGAYIDVCYLQFRINTRFPVTAANDEVTITRAELSGNTLTVWATTTATFEEPQPILRAYFCWPSANAPGSVSRRSLYRGDRCRNGARDVLR